MFIQLLDEVKSDIETIRSVIVLNDNLRQILYGNEKIGESHQSLQRLATTIPRVADWRVYEYCSVVTRLYAIYERFVEELVKIYLNNLPDLFNSYSELDKKIQRTHCEGVGNLLLKIERGSNRYKHLCVEDVVRCLFFAVTNNSSGYNLLPDAFLLYEQNLRRQQLEEIFNNIGIQNAWGWIEKHEDVRLFIEETRSSEKNAAEKELEEFIEFRNEAAHGKPVDELVGTSTLLELCTFIEVLCQALSELILYHAINRKAEIGKAKEFGEVTEWFSKASAAIVKVKNITLKIGDQIFISKDARNYSCCRMVLIKSLQIDSVSKDQIEIGEDEVEVGIKFNVEVRKGLKLYAVAQ